MKLAALAAVGALALASCQSTKLAGFFGTSDPCAQGAAAHAAFVTVAATQPKVAKYAKAERAAYAAFTAQCADGDLSKATLAKALNAYSAAIAEWRN